MWFVAEESLTTCDEPPSFISWRKQLERKEVEDERIGVYHTTKRLDLIGPGEDLDKPE